MALGATVGLVYGMFQNLTQKRNILYQLDPNPEAFCIDPKMSELFNRLNQFRKWNPEAYVTALEDTDRLFQHEIAIRKRGAEFGDLSTAQMWINSVNSDLIEFREQIHNHKDRLQFQRVASAICNRLDIHNRNIIRRASRLYGQMNM